MKDCADIKPLETIFFSKLCASLNGEENQPLTKYLSGCFVDTTLLLCHKPVPYV